MENKVNTSDVSPGVQCLSRRWHQWPACWHGNSCHHIVPLRLGSIDVLLAAPKGSPEASLDPSALPCSSLRQHYMSHSPEAQFKTEIEQAEKKKLLLSTGKQITISALDSSFDDLILSRDGTR